MRALKRRDDVAGEEPILHTDLADECEAFLEGSLVRCLQGHGAFAPVWTWLNEAAHGDEGEIRLLAEQLDTDATDAQVRTRSAIARAVVHALTDRRLADLQRDLLVPLELRVAGTVLSPRRLVELVGRALYL